MATAGGFWVAAGDQRGVQVVGGRHGHHRHGVAPKWLTASQVAILVLLGKIDSSPRPTLSARKASRRASRPGATLRAFCAPPKAAHLASKASTYSPSMNCPLSETRPRGRSCHAVHRGAGWRSVRWCSPAGGRAGPRSRADSRRSRAAPHRSAPSAETPSSLRSWPPAAGSRAPDAWLIRSSTGACSNRLPGGARQPISQT